MPAALSHSAQPIRSTTPVGHAVRAVLLGLTFVMAAPSSHATGPRALDAVPEQTYVLPAGPLGSSLVAFASHAGIALSFDPALTQGRSSRAVSGRFGAREAVAQLLAGSGLEIVAAPDGSYTLRRQPAPPPGASTPGNDASPPAHTLPAVKVTAAPVADGPPPYAGGQVARGGRLGMLGNADTMEAPFNLSSFTSSAIQDRQAASVADVLANDPSVRVSGQASDVLDSVFIRGFPVGDQNAGEIAFNGVYGVAPNYRVLTDYVERIEVVKGPTALLYGISPAGSVGGAINIVPKRAADTDLTRFTVSHAGESQLGAHLDLGRRFGDQREHGVRLNLSHVEGDTPLDNQSRRAGVAALALDHQGERLRASLDVIEQREKVDAPSRRPFLAAGVAVPKAPDGRRNVTQAWEWFETEDLSVLAHAEFDLDESLTLFAGAGGGRARVDRLFGNPTILNAQGDTSTLPQRFLFEVDRETADVGLRSRFTTGSVRHGLTLQASTYRDEIGRASAAGTAVASNLYEPVAQPEQNIAAPASVPKLSETTFDGLALSDTLTMFDGKALLTLGLRWQQVRSHNFGAVTLAYSKSATTPLLGIVVKPWAGTSFYANYIEGLTKGDTAPDNAANAGETFAPYKTRQHELGMKIDHGRLITTVSAFQITKPSGQLTGTQYAADGEQRNRGLELSAVGEAAPGLRLMSGVTLLEATLTRTNSAETQGKSAVGAPEVTANLGVDWDLPFSPGTAVSANAAHTGRQYANRANTQALPAWTTLELGARHATRVAGAEATFRLGVRNVFDRAYWAGASQWGSLVQGAPRTVLASATFGF